jgi:hypothetical protein
MKKKLDLRQELEELEGHFSPVVPGTIISRSLHTDTEPGWVIAFGPMTMPKKMFYGYTIEECLTKARKFVETGDPSLLGVRQTESGGMV